MQGPKIILPFLPSSLAEIEQLRKSEDYINYQMADLVEWRADFLPAQEILKAAKMIFQIFSKNKLIFTLRTENEGGYFSGSLNSYILINRIIMQEFEPAYIDLEVVTKPDLKQIFTDKEHLIYSYHNFEKIPENLSEIVESMAQAHAAIIKFAVNSRSRTEVWQILEVADRLREQYQVPVIAIAMGEEGKISRVVAPDYTFAAISDENAFAGQLPFMNLRQILRLLY